VDGRRRRVFAVAPALVAVTLPAGHHAVTFRYVGFSGYPMLFALSAGAMALLVAVDRRGGRRRAWPRHDDTDNTDHQ
jgi:hypothetical protein